MSAVIRGNVRMAWSSIKSTRWRSGFTMLGVVVAVVPVLTILGIGEGVKRQISDQVADFGTGLLTIRPGFDENSSNPLTQFHSLSGYSTSGTFTARDLAAVESVESVDMVAPLSVVPGKVSAGTQPAREGFVIGTTENFPALLKQNVRHGDFFTELDQNRAMAVVGRSVAESLFGDSVPLGRAFDFRGETFVVRGVLEKLEVAPLSFTADFNNAIIIPYQKAVELAGEVPIYEMMARPKDEQNITGAARDITTALERSRGGETNFSVLTQAESQRVVNRILALLTALVSGVAAIALLVSGIGIMNIMLVSVTERMHEIGVRKAIGATKRQILGQFMAEAVLLSAAGGIIGIVLSFVVAFLIRLTTQLEPVITWQATVLVATVSLLVGVLFGAFPALKAARKDPIDALRYE